MRLYDNARSGAVTRARELRKAAPEPERRLWRALRESFPHLKWRRQVPIGPYFADLLCFSERLVIEVDGDTHGETKGYDAARTRAIAAQGFRVMRVTNREVMRSLEGVLIQISLFLGEREGALQARQGEGWVRS